MPVLAASLCLLRDGDDNISCRWLVEAAKLCMRVWDSLECHLNVYLSYKSGVLPKRLILVYKHVNINLD